MAKTHTATPPATPAAKTKVPKHRSPNYPTMGLERALAKVALVYNSEFRRHAVPIKDGMAKMEYSADSSTGQQALASMKYFGLVEFEGTGDKRMVRVSEPAAKIVANHADRDRLLKEAALAPAIHREVWDKFNTPDGLAPDATIRQYLVWDREDSRFSEEAATAFLTQFKQTISFAKLTGSATIPEVKTDGGIKVGDWVQWVSQGMAQFGTPREVVEVAERDGERYARVVAQDGAEGWIPVNQATLEKAPTGGGTGLPFIPPKRDSLPPEVGMEESRWKLPSGHAILRYPSKLTKRDFEVLKKQVDLLEFSATDEETE